MERKIIVVGDPPTPGGRVLPYGGPTAEIHGHQAALIGGRAYCEGCNSVGIIAKAGGPRRMQFLGEVALEGDVVVCHCPIPPALVATLQQSANFDDGMSTAAGAFNASAIPPQGWFSGDSAAVAASKKLVDAAVSHPPEAEQTENICPNMTNKEFATKWFGQDDEDLRRHLDTGLKACIRVLKGLTEANFVRYSEEAMRNVGCIPSGNIGRLAAEVCKPDLKTRTIGIGFPFCELPDISYRIDSKLATILHEVTHFDDVFSSTDTVYQMAQSLKLMASNPSAARVNADSVVGFVLYGD
ncbi:Lysine-specific metallo-endopeptidase [compost metagenome]